MDALTAMKQALEALDMRCSNTADERKELIPSLRALIEEMEGAEPVEVVIQERDVLSSTSKFNYENSERLFEIIESMKPNADRYHWLRQGDNDEQVLKFSSEARCGTDHVWLLRGEELDAAIDKARCASVT